MTRVTAAFEVASIEAPRERREQAITALGYEVRVVADDTRSQLRNRELAVERIEDRLRGALRPQKRRRPTKPSAGSKRRRREAKSRRSDLKKSRQKPRFD